MIKNNDIMLQQRIVTERLMSKLTTSGFLLNNLIVNGAKIRPYEIPLSSVDMDEDINSDKKIINALYQLRYEIIKGMTINISELEEYYVKDLISANINDNSSISNLETASFTRVNSMYYLVVGRYRNIRTTDIYIPFIIVDIDNVPYALINVTSYKISSNIKQENPTEWKYYPLVDTNSIGQDCSFKFAESIIKDVLTEYGSGDYTLITTINEIPEERYEFRYPGGDSRYLFILQKYSYDDKIIELTKNEIYNNLPIVKFEDDRITEILVTNGFDILSVSLRDFMANPVYKVIIFSSSDGYFIDNISSDTIFLLNNTKYYVEESKYVYDDKINKYKLELDIVRGEAGKFFEYYPIDDELKIIVAENFAYGEASKPKLTESSAASLINKMSSKSEIRSLYNSVKDGSKKLVKNVKITNRKLTKHADEFIDDATLFKETNTLLNNSWNLLMRVATSYGLSILLGPIVGIFIFICLQARKINFNSEVTLKKIEDNIQTKLDYLEQELKKAEKAKDHELAYKYKRIITKTKAKLEVAQKKISKDTEGSATSFEINRREKLV